MEDEMVIKGITPFEVTWTIIALSIQHSAFSPQLSA